jgi:hypothetical protein
MNSLEILYNLYPDKDWDYEHYLSRNPNTTWDMIKNNLDRDWDWYFLSSNSSITIDIIDSNPSLPWNWFQGVSQNPNIDLEIVKSFPEKIILDNEFFHNPNININYSNKFWRWYELLHNPNIKWDMVLENKDKDKCLYTSLLYNPNTTSEIIEDILTNYLEYIGIPIGWHILHLSNHKNLTFDIIKKFHNLPWEWRNLSRNPCITIDIIRNNPDKKWDWYNMSSNPNMTFEFIKDNLDKAWNWIHISCHRNITWDIVEENPNIPWDWLGLSANSNITWDIVQNNPDKPWNNQGLSANPNITWEIVHNNITEKSDLSISWDWKYISQNIFLKHPIVLKNFNKKNSEKRIIKRILDNEATLYADILYMIYTYL